MKWRFRIVWASLALLGAGAGALDVAVLSSTGGGQGGAAVCPRHGLRDPVEVAARFLATAVERRDLSSSYTLAAPSLRGARSCADWTRGRVPVTAFKDIDWSRASYQSVAGGDGQLVLRVLLYRTGVADGVPFLMELQTESSEPGWHVGWFGRDRWYRPSSPAA